VTREAFIEIFARYALEVVVADIW